MRVGIGHNSNWSPTTAEYEGFYNHSVRISFESLGGSTPCPPGSDGSKLPATKKLWRIGGRNLAEDAEDPAKTVAQTIRATCPDATHLMALLGEPVDEVYVSAFTARYGAGWLNLLLDKSRVDGSFAAIWKRMQGRPQWETIELLLAEHWICLHPNAIARALPKQMYFSKTLHTIQGTIALALYTRARSLNWREPVSFMRGMRISERYLRQVVENIDFAQPAAAKEFEGRLAVSQILRARYDILSESEAIDAIHYMERSIANGNNSDDALAYLSEAYLRLNDATGRPESLTKLAGMLSTGGPRSATIAAAVAEGCLRLADSTTKEPVRIAALSRARQCLSFIRSESDPIAWASALIIEALLDSKPRVLALRHLRLPFGIATQIRSWISADLNSTCLLAGAILEKLQAGSVSFPDELVFRRIRASIHSAIGRAASPSLSGRVRLENLESAIALRTASVGQRALKDAESRLENALDLFEMHRISSVPLRFISAVHSALGLLELDQGWPLPFLVLARQVRTSEAPLPVPIALELRRIKLQSASAKEALSYVLSLDADSLFGMAASRALESREIDRHNLGGRGGSFLAQDYNGVLTRTFVFKATTNMLYEREVGRSAKIAEAIDNRRLHSSFGVAKTLARSYLPPDDRLRRHGAETLVAREFHFGTLLRDEVISVNNPGGILGGVVRFLALIHATEGRSALDSPKGVRRDLKRKEFGRWLRDGLRCKDFQALFDDWYGLFPVDQPLAPRRDAHHLNWLVTPGGKIVALDLEACGWRHAGYELAQLLDDAPMLTVDDQGWRARRELLKLYVKSMREFGAQLEFERTRKSFEASLIARSVHTLTAPEANSEFRHHAEQLLDWLSQRATTADVRSLAMRVREAWRLRRGIGTSAVIEIARVSDGRRRHLSRAMAYELRHGTQVVLTKGGWANVNSIVQQLALAKVKTSSDELLAVATAVDEGRFEVRDGMIRALYGHSRPVVIEYDKACDATLYHGTAFKNLDLIFAEEQGLLPMTRHWVHLSTDPLAALRTARRHGPGVLLALEPNNSLEVYRAGGPVHLCRHVPSSLLRIISPVEMFFR